MAGYRILIVADSQGRLLDSALSSILSDYNYLLVWRKGLRLCQTMDFISHTVKKFKPHLVYLLQGICDITMIRHSFPRTIAMRHPSPEITTYNFMSLVDQLHAQIYSLSDEIGHPIMIICSSQTGMDLGMYNGLPDGLTYPDQPFLDKAILMINKQISILNKSMSIITPFLSSAVHMRCRGRYRTAYNKLSDGCHPTLQLCRVWAHKLLHNLEHNIGLYDRYALINQMY